MAADAQYVGLLVPQGSAGPRRRHLPGLKKMTDALGTYPHAAIIPTVKEVRPATTLRLTCSACGCVATMLKKWLTEAGRPTCGCGAPMTTGDEGDDDA